ncbi:hypothetical protein SANTM175S_04354 [Streptomyces antimycoticus]
MFHTIRERVSFVTDEKVRWCSRQMFAMTAKLSRKLQIWSR